MEFFLHVHRALQELLFEDFILLAEGPSQQIRRMILPAGAEGVRHSRCPRILPAGEEGPSQQMSADPSRGGGGCPQRRDAGEEGTLCEI